MTRVGVLSDLWVPFPGGAERLIFNLARDLNQRDHIDVRVLTGYEPAQPFNGPPVEYQPIEVRDDHHLGWKRIAEWIDRTHPDVLISHHFYANEFAQELAECTIPTVQIVLNGKRHPVDLAVYISEHIMTITPPAFDDVIANGHGDAVGFIKPIAHKGAALVYEIAERMPDREFVILRGEWQASELIRDDLPNVTYLQPVDDIRTFYERVRVVLMPSTSEDAGTVAQECALNRIPCISSDVDGIRETNAGGIRMPNRDPNRWAETITLLDNPSAYEQVTSRQASRLAEVGHGRLLDEFASRIRTMGGQP